MSNISSLSPLFIQKLKMASRILNSQVAASIKRAGVRFQSTAVDGGFTAERDAIKHHAAGK